MNKPHHFFYALLFSLLYMWPLCLHSQDTLTTPYIDISKANFATTISRSSASAFIEHNETLVNKWKDIHFKKGMIHLGTIPGKDVTRKPILRFNLINKADTAISVWFFPGFFYSDINLYKAVGNSLEKLPAILPNIQDNVGYRQITLNGKDSASFYAELKLVKTHINTMRPRIIHANRVESFIKDMQDANSIDNTITYLFSGLLLMMILFSLANYVQGANKEFLYYAGYAFFVGGMLFTKALYHYRPNYVGYFLEGYMDFIMVLKE